MNRPTNSVTYSVVRMGADGSGEFRCPFSVLSVSLLKLLESTFRQCRTGRSNCNPTHFQSGFASQIPWNTAVTSWVKSRSTQEPWKPKKFESPNRFRTHIDTSFSGHTCKQLHNTSTTTCRSSKLLSDEILTEELPKLVPSSLPM